MASSTVYGLLLLSLCGVAFAATGAPFNYTASGLDWLESCERGVRQSPINIVRGNAVDAGTSTAFSLSYSPITQFNLKNTGVVIQVTPANAAESKLVLRDGSVYSLLQLHFHGFSEHAIDGQLGPLEVHFVHVGDANATKLAVVGVLFRLHPDDLPNTVLQSIVDELPKTVSNKTMSVTADWASLLNIKSKGQRVYTYLGSLTTPLCDERVEWSVLAKTQYISVAQAIKFYDAIAAVAHGDWTDNRPPQPLKGRTVETFMTTK